MAQDTDASPQAGLVPRAIAWALRLKVVRAFLHYAEHRGPMLADSITYRALFSVFAGVLLGFSLAGLWLSGNPGAWQALIDAVDSAIPGLVGAGGIIEPDSIRIEAGLTVAGILSLAGLVGAAIGAIGSLRTALRVIADQATDDTLIVWVLLRNLLLALGIGAALIASAAATFAGTAFLGTVNTWFGIAPDSVIGGLGPRAIAIVATFALDTAVIAFAFRMLSGVRAPARALWSGALLGGVGLTVLQQLSGLFIGGASANPLLGTFAALIALLLWFNLSAQVILIASAYIVTGVEDLNDRVHAQLGADTFILRRVRNAERAVTVATAELATARKAADDERDRAAEAAKKKAAAGS